MSKWEMVKLGDVCSLIGGGTPDRSNTEYWNGSIPWISVKDFKSLTIDSAQESITELGLKNSASNLIPSGTIVIPTRMALGKVAVCSVDMAINQDLKAIFINDNSKLLNQYLFYTLLSKSKHIESRGKGATVKGVTLDVIKSIEFPLPPLDIQKQIVVTLELAQALIDQRKQQIGLIDTLIQSTFYDMFGDPVENNKGWEVKKIGDSIKFTGGSQPAKSDFVYEPQEGYVRLVQTRDFRTNKFPTYIPVNKAKRLFSKHDIIVGRYGPPIFQVFRGLEGSYNVALMKASPLVDYNLDFLFFLLRDKKIHEIVDENSQRTGGQTGVNLDLLNEIVLAYPPIGLQNMFSERFQHIDTLKQQMSISIAELEQNFNALMQQIFAG